MLVQVCEGGEVLFKLRPGLVCNVQGFLTTVLCKRQK